MPTVWRDASYDSADAVDFARSQDGAAPSGREGKRRARVVRASSTRPWGRTDWGLEFQMSALVHVEFLMLAKCVPIGGMVRKGEGGLVRTSFAGTPRMSHGGIYKISSVPHPVEGVLPSQPSMISASQLI